MNSIPSIDDAQALSPAPGTQNPTVRREALRLEWDLGGRLLYAEKAEDKRFLNEFNNADVLLLSHGKILVAKELKSNSPKLIRKIIHEEIEAILQIMAKEDYSKYVSLRSIILSQDGIREKYYGLFQEGQKQGLSNDLLANDIVASALELLIPKINYLIQDHEITDKEAEFLRAIEPVINANRHNYFTGMFWDTNIREVKIRIAMANGLKLYQVSGREKGNIVGVASNVPSPNFSSLASFNIPPWLEKKVRAVLKEEAELKKLLGIQQIKGVMSINITRESDVSGGYVLEFFVETEAGPMSFYAKLRRFIEEDLETRLINTRKPGEVKIKNRDPEGDWIEYTLGNDEFVLTTKRGNPTALEYKITLEAANAGILPPSVIIEDSLIIHGIDDGISLKDLTRNETWAEYFLENEEYFVKEIGRQYGRLNKELGILHRDIALEHIFITRGKKVYLIDLSTESEEGYLSMKAPPSSIGRGDLPRAQIVLEVWLDPFVGLGELLRRNVGSEACSSREELYPKWLQEGYDSVKNNVPATTNKPVFNLTDIPVSYFQGKYFFVRTNLDDTHFDLSEKSIDDIRINKTALTADYISRNGGISIMFNHIGRPDGKYEASLITDRIAGALGRVLNKPVKKMNGEILPDGTFRLIGETERRIAGELRPGDILMLENTRMDPREQSRDPLKRMQLAKEIVGLAPEGIFVMDGFPITHRNDTASVTDIAGLLPGVKGLWELDEEVLHDDFLAWLQNQQKRGRLTAIFGGQKEDKKDEIFRFNEAHLKAGDTLILGGKFGDRLIDKTTVDTLIKKGVRVLLPLDSNEGKDIGQKTIRQIQDVLKNYTDTVFFEGPLGKFEEEPFNQGTFQIVRLIADLTQKKQIKRAFISGGELGYATKRALRWNESSRNGIEGFTISTGGGTSIAYLANSGKLPGTSNLKGWEKKERISQKETAPSTVAPKDTITQRIEITLPSDGLPEETTFTESLKGLAETTWQEFGNEAIDISKKAALYETKKQSLILYADDILKNALVVDLENAVKNLISKHNLLNGGKIILFARKKVNATILENIVRRASQNTEIVTIMNDDLQANSDEMKEVEKLIANARAKNAGEILALIKGPTKKWEELAKFAANSNIPIILIGPEKGIYSFAQALTVAIDAKINKGATKGWLILLEPIRPLTDDIRWQYEEYQHSLQTLVAA